MTSKIIVQARSRIACVVSTQTLLDLVRWLDQRIVQAIRSADEVGRSVLSRVLAQSLIALAEELIARSGEMPRVAVTIAVAKCYVRDPSDQNRSAYFRAATMSYPIGPGEGCYCVKELGYSGCSVGSGCISGSGTLYLCAVQLGMQSAVDILQKSIVPWLEQFAESASGTQ